MKTRVMDLLKLFKSFFIWKIVIIEFICIQAIVNFSFANNTLEKCSLLPEIGDIVDRLEKIFKQGTYKLVKIYLEITGDAGPYTRGTLGQMLHTQSWLLTTGRAGRTMLLLKENSEEMSLGYLSLGVTKLNITVMQNPKQCLSRLTDLQAEEIVPKAILTGFANSSVALYDGAEVCSRYFNVSQTRLAELVYKCCRLSHSNTLDCYDLKASAWQFILFAFVVVAVLIFSSKFIPSSLVKFESEFDLYQFNPPSRNTLAIRLLKVEEQPDERFVRIQDPSFVLQGQIREELKLNTLTEILVANVVFRLRPNELVQDSQSPVSVLSFLWHFLFRCQLRSEISSLRSCCDANVFRKFSNIKWYDFLRTVMCTFFFGLLLTPWIIRVCFYYNYELKIEEQLQHAFALKKLPYTGSLASYLFPNHPLFIAIYVILAIQTLLWLILKKKFNVIVQTCMFNMPTLNVLELLDILASSAVEPLKCYGIFGCLVFPFFAAFIAFIFIVTILLVFPIVNLSVRLLGNCIFYLIATMNPRIYTNMLRSSNKITKALRRDIVKHGYHNSRKNNLIYALELLSTLMIILSLTTLVTACIYFYVEASVYTLIGIILNYSDKMSYISSVLWITVYFYECFTPAHSEYSTFCKTIHSEIRDKIDRTEIEREVFLNILQYGSENRAFQFQSTTNMQTTERIKLVSGTDGALQWKAPRVCLFLDKYHKPYIPKRMLFELAKTIDHSSCPKQLHIIYFNCLIDFIKVAVFVYFYFVAISAFGQEIAVFAIGSVPLVIRKFLTKAKEKKTVKNNIAWEKALRNALEEYKQDWAVNGLEAVGDGNELSTDCVYADVDLLVVKKMIAGRTDYEYFVRRIEPQPEDIV